MDFPQYSSRLWKTSYLTSDPSWRRTGSKFSPVIDSFHLPYPHHHQRQILTSSDLNEPTSYDPTIRRGSIPESNDDVPTSHTPVQSQDNPFSKLPKEVSDLILSHLSPAALDAARHTCKLWRHKIMTDRWVLSAVLTGMARRENQQPSMDDEKLHPDLRTLLKTLDRLCYVPFSSLDSRSDEWRTRFRIRNLDFKQAEIIAPLTSRNDALGFRAVARVGCQCGFLVFQLTVASEGQRANTVLTFFRSEVHDIPSYVGSVKVSANLHPITTFSLAEKVPQRSWLMKIGFGDHNRFYSIKPRTAFSNTEPHYIVAEVNGSDIAQPQGDVTIKASTSNAFCAASGKRESGRWAGLVASLPVYSRLKLVDEISPHPSRGTLSEVPLRARTPSFVDKVYPHDELGSSKNTLCHFDYYDRRQYLAEDIESGNLILVEASDNPGSLVEAFPDYIAQKINKDYVWSSVLLRPCAESVFRNVAVAPLIWTYITTTRVAIIWQTKEKAGSGNPRSELYAYELPEFPNHQEIQGRRITSLGNQVGGIHPSSQIHDFATTEAFRKVLQREAALGGLQLPHSSGTVRLNGSRFQYHKCFIWGPVRKEGTDSIQCKIIDFSFANRERPIVGTMADHKSKHCACSLHDDGFQIVLPRIKNLHQPLQPPGHGVVPIRKSSYWPRDVVQSPRKMEEPLPVITPIHSKARQEALGREQEWYKERIRGMRRVGLPDLDIAEMWACSTWTGYGQIRKPEGWRDL